MIEGWLCPRCGHVLAPFVRECTCLPPTRSASSTLVLMVDGQPIVVRICTLRVEFRPKATSLTGCDGGRAELASRSVQRRVALQKGEEMPEFGGAACIQCGKSPCSCASPSAPIDLTALIELLAHETGYDDELFKIDAIQRDEIVLALRLLRVLRHPVKPMAWVHEGHVMLDVMDEINDVTLDEAERALVIGGNHDD